MTSLVEKTYHPNIIWHEGNVSLDNRCKLLKQLPKTIWFTGLSASGKSTLAYSIERCLIDMGHPCYVLDGDNIRHGLNKDLSFSDKERTENIRRVAEVAKLFNDAGLIVITSFISPNRNDREFAKEIISKDRFVEVYVSTPIETCEARDPKGMYKKARNGKIKNFTGVGSLYEPPIHPFMVIDTSTYNESECTHQVVSKLLDNEVLKFYE